MSAIRTGLTWEFPLPEPGAGVLMGNGTMGLMVWREAGLNLTVSRNGFRDRRAGATFEKIRERKHR
jgi:hypothetical protein